MPQVRSSLALAALTQQWSGGLSRLLRRTADKIGLGVSREDVASAAAELRQAGAKLTQMNRLLNPPEVVLAGPPNVGKSTLANALVGRPVSIVHHTPGTTRDWVRELAVLDGVAVWLTDTAGLWEEAPSRNKPRLQDLEQAQGIDAEAARRARNRAESADLVLLLHASGDQELNPPICAGRLLRVASKSDVRPPKGNFDVAVSSLTGRGLPGLRRAVLEALDLADIDPIAPMAFTPRQAKLLESAAAEMERGRSDPAREIVFDILR
jgi:tRNA modification GTPase